MRHWWPFAAAIFAPLVHYLLPAPHSALCLQSCSVERCDAKTSTESALLRQFGGGTCWGESFSRFPLARHLFYGSWSAA